MENELLNKIIKLLEDKKAIELNTMDVKEKTTLADYFVIANGSNQHQIEAMRDAVDEELYKAGAKVKQVEGNRSSSWLLMDYGEIIVHVFSKEDRLFYDLERIWGDGKFIDAAELGC